mmetsp:Transcript_6908/g.20567  ORF Transcript_6908/g.20567 Transcript_6908/m.20567 type:complete len:206 (-) Transcript_6908:811-1428(-)
MNSDAALFKIGDSLRFTGEGAFVKGSVVVASILRLQFDAGFAACAATRTRKQYLVPLSKFFFLHRGNMTFALSHWIWWYNFHCTSKPFGGWSSAEHHSNSTLSSFTSVTRNPTGAGGMRSCSRICAARLFAAMPAIRSSNIEACFFALACSSRFRCSSAMRSCRSRSSRSFCSRFLRSRSAAKRAPRLMASSRSRWRSAAEGLLQ